MTSPRSKTSASRSGWWVLAHSWNSLFYNSKQFLIMFAWGGSFWIWLMEFLCYVRTCMPDGSSLFVWGGSFWIWLMEFLCYVRTCMPDGSSLFFLFFWTLQKRMKSGVKVIIGSIIPSCATYFVWIVLNEGRRFLFVFCFILILTCW